MGIFDFLTGKSESEKRMPTVKFDASRVTDAIKADIRKNVEVIEGLDPVHIDQVYSAAVRSVLAGRDLALLTNALWELNIDGMTKKRAAQIARALINKATALLDREQQQSLGITEAVWLYSGAPCEMDPKKPSGHQDAAHKAANGKRYKIAEGMFLDGKYTWPGYEDGCRCVTKSVIPGFD